MSARAYLAQAVVVACMSKNRESAHPLADASADGYIAFDTDTTLLGESVGPKERTHMPLSAAAHWIASEGWAIPITANETSWRPAFEKLLARIVSGKLAVTGRHSGLPKAVPSDLFVSIPVAYPCSNSLQLWIGDGPYLDSSHFIGEADWERTGGDKLFRSGRDRRAEWTHLQVASCDIVRLWPFRRRKTAHEERAATDALAKVLREQPHLTVASARRQCDAFNRLGRVLRKRVWERARESVDLPAKASPGRPRKS